MAAEGLGPVIGPAVVLMGAAVIAVPLFRRLGLGSVLGYFAAGALVGPSVLGFFTDPDTILHFAELGVVIPPSCPMILFGVAAEVSIGEVFIAGFGPGVLIGGALIVGASMTAVVVSVGSEVSASSSEPVS